MVWIDFSMLSVIIGSGNVPCSFSSFPTFRFPSCEIHSKVKINKVWIEFIHIKQVSKLSQNSPNCEATLNITLSLLCSQRISECGDWCVCDSLVSRLELLGVNRPVKPTGWTPGDATVPVPRQPVHTCPPQLPLGFHTLSEGKTYL